MADFDVTGPYRFIYTDDTNEPIKCNVRANSDDDAIGWARQVQHGMALEVWKGEACLDRLPRPDRLLLWPER